MRIGIDFDNTIACYDGVFHAAALERGLIPAGLARDKNAVRDYLNGSGFKNDFTALQGYVYGARMDLAALYPGVREFVTTARANGHAIFVVSHKTKTPLLGPAYDMHAAARAFLVAQDLVSDEAIAPINIFFELTKEEKLSRARALSLDVFIDDLPEILASNDFPSHARAILFDPEGRADRADFSGARIETHRNWPSISSALLT